MYGNIRGVDAESSIGFMDTESQMLETIDTLFDRFTSREAYFSLNAIQNSFITYNALWRESIQERNDNVATYYEPYYEGEAIYEYTQGYIQELLYISLNEGTSLYNDVVKKSALTRRISLTLIVAVFLLALLFGWLFSTNLVKPIKALAKSSKEMAAGNLNVEAVQINTLDEVGVLAKSFNTMSSSIRDYIEDLKQKVVIEKKLHEEELAIIRMEQLLQDAEFQALQSQINPHFLFNTLNTISRTAMFEEAEDTVKLIQALSNIFRYRIRNTGDTITLKEELWLIQEYVYLQKVRFKDRIDFSVVTKGDLESVIIPIFTLQPIIENAIIHGLEPKIEGGKLRVKIIVKKNMTMIKMTDTGVGMEKEQLEALINNSKNHKASRIGVSNVYNRFKMHYGKKGKFCMYSRVGMGTMVKLRIYKEVNGKVKEINGIA
jgi:sensor histidine kinase YesM